MPPEANDAETPPTPHVLTLHVNGEPHVLAQGCTISALLLDLGLDGRRIAVAINRDVVPRSCFSTHRLAAEDRVEILEAVGGG